MHGQRPKKQSRRLKLGTKYKIQKNVREHNRKLKKESRKKTGRFRKRKDPGVPNSAPFKAELIHEAKLAQAAEEERREMQRMELKMRRKGDRNKIFENNRNIREVMEDAQKRGEDFISTKSAGLDHNKFTDKSAKAYYKEFKKVIESADVILEVLDARDPQGTRCPAIEETVTSNSNKRLVLVLNKADLVPKSSLEAWLKYLRREYPTLLFKASTQSQAKNLSHARGKPFKDARTLQTSRCVGGDALMQLLKNYCRNCGIKTAITVGVVGLPNVGKSSLINSLKRTKACNIGATPGVTKTIQEVTLDSKVHLIDCPGVILPGENSSDAGSCLRNAFKVQSLEDPISPVEEIIKRVGKEQLRQQYTLSEFGDTMEFLALLAKKTGKLGKKGTLQFEDAARRVIQDWNVGRIKYYTLPPMAEEVTETTAIIVQKMSKEFSMDDLKTTEAGLLDALPDVADKDTVRVDALMPLQAVCSEVEAAEEEDPMEEENSEEQHDEHEPKSILPKNIHIDLPSKSAVIETPPERKPRWETVHKEIDLSETSLRKLQKQRTKKHRKEVSRNERRADDLVQCLESFEGIKDDDYDFNEYFSKA